MFIVENLLGNFNTLYPVNPEIAIVIPHPAKCYQVPVAFFKKYAYGFNISFGMLLSMMCKIIEGNYISAGDAV